MSDRQIAEHVGVDPMTVGKYRKELSATVETLQSPARTGRGGTKSLGNFPSHPPATCPHGPGWNPWVPHHNPPRNRGREIPGDSGKSRVIPGIGLTA